MTKPAYGSFRRLPSKRWQVRYTGPDGLRRTMPATYRTKADAQAAWSILRAEMVSGRWVDPQLSAQTLDAYARAWVNERDLAERTRELYRSLLRLHLLPYLGHLMLREVSPAVVRAWRAERVEVGVGASTVAKAYSLLRAIMTTAADDGFIPRNPCRIRGAGFDPTPEREVLTPAQVAALADAVEPRWRLLVLLACFAHLRYGELMGLVRDDLDLDAMVVHVRRSIAEVGGSFVVKPPKSGRMRTVSLPPTLRDEIVTHLDRYADTAEPWRVFVGVRGSTLRRSNWAPIWNRARITAGVPSSVHLHDLRHTGNHFAAQSGATARELMARMGHASMRAALIYQHATEERDRAIADGLDLMLNGRRDGGDAGERGA